MKRLPRSGGVLLHPTSLPGPFGIGDIGPAAERWVHALADAGMLWWQTLPIGPVDFVQSPYASPSSRAGNWMLMSPERLAEQGLLTASELREAESESVGRVDFDDVIPRKRHLLRRAWGRFRDTAALEAFAAKDAEWLDDYALFMALREERGGLVWTEWEPGLVRRRSEDLAAARSRLAREIHYYRFEQYQFWLQWEILSRTCRERGIRIIGDLPIFVALDSVDVWCRPDLFRLDERGRPTVVAGVPPDAFTADGQRWGNPLYDWDAHAAEGYAWWIERLRACARAFDLVRLDHFRGFAAYWEVPAESLTARVGRWVAGPGAEFLSAVERGLGGLPLIAEDLGNITPDVLELRDAFGLPGMRVLQFGFGIEPDRANHAPHNFTPHSVAYTGTHDNDTVVGWLTHSLDALTEEQRQARLGERRTVLRYLGTTGESIAWDMIRLAWASVADTAIVPMQDVLGLGSEARMNVPGRTGSPNWGWRMTPDAPLEAALGRLGEFTTIYERTPGPGAGDSLLI